MDSMLSLFSYKTRSSMETWTIVLVLHGVALYNAAFCSPPVPVGARFSSINLQNWLQWDPGNQTPPNTYFSVQYAVYGDMVDNGVGRRLHWRPVPECRVTALTRCDLTRQTWDLEQGYYARVRAADHRGFSKWAATGRRFDPKSDTVLGPPAVAVETKGNSAIISIKPPVRFQPDDSEPEVTMLEVYPQMTYNLSYRIGGGENLTHHIQLLTSPYVYRPLEYDTRYCFSARARFSSMPIDCQPSPWHCKDTPQDPVVGQLRSIVVGVVVPLFCVCVLGVGGFFVHYQVWGKKEKWPQTLEATHYPISAVAVTPERVVKCVHVNAVKDMPPPPPPPVTITRPPPGVYLHATPWQRPAGNLPDLLPAPCGSSYAPQGQAGSPPGPAAPWEWGRRRRDSEAASYGFVGAVPVTEAPAGSEGPGEPPRGGGEGERRGGSEEKEVEEEEQEEEEGNSGIINWDPESRVLMLPEAWRQGDGGVDLWLLGAGGVEEEEEEEEEEVGREGLRLETVFVRQNSQQEMEAARETDWGRGTFLENWRLVVESDE